LVAAVRRAVGDDDARSAVGALVNAWEVLVRTGPYPAAFELAESVHAVRGLNDSQRATADWIGGRAPCSMGREGGANGARATGAWPRVEPPAIAVRHACSCAGLRSNSLSKEESRRRSRMRQKA